MGAAPGGPFAARHQVGGGLGQREGEQQPHQQDGLAGLHGGHGQRAEGDELALRDEQDAGNGEDEQDGQRQERVDGAVGDAVLPEYQGNLSIHAKFRKADFPPEALRAFPQGHACGPAEPDPRHPDGTHRDCFLATPRSA